MNITAYIQGFNSYLELEGKNKHKEYVTNGNTASIFMYSNEFKDYMQSEIGVNLKSVSITDILSMDVKNGKLVEKGQADGVPENDSLQGEKDASTLNFLNMFLNDDKLKNAINKDNNEIISKDELNFFLNGIKGLDDDSENISMEDILSAAEALQNGTLDLNALNETEQATEVPEGNKPASNVNKSSATHNSGNDSNSNGNTNPTDSNNTNSEKNLKNMSLEELNTELKNAETSLSDKEKVLSDITSGTDTAIAGLKKDVDEKYTAYKESIAAVNEELATSLNEKVQLINEKEQEIEQNDVEITKTNNVIDINQNAYNNAVQNIQSLENQKAELTAINTSEMSDSQKADIANKIQQAEAAIRAAEAERDEASNNLENAKNTLAKLEDNKTQYKKELQTLNDEKAEIDKQIADLEKDHPEITEAKQAWEDAKQALTDGKATAKTEAETKMNEAKDYLKEVQNARLEAQKEDNKSKFSPEPEYNAKAGDQLADIASNTEGTVGYCLRGVAKSVAKWLGEKTQLSHLGSAYMAVEALRTDPVLKQHFKEVQVDRSELSSLPKGAIVVWDRGAPNASAAGKKHGHISIALGNGQESSDHIQKQMTNRQSQFYVFYPVA